MNSLKKRLQAHPFVVIGHRGAAGLICENTLASFALALNSGCPMIELDVHRVKDAHGDDQLIVIHDAKVDRTTRNRGRVEDLSFEQIRSIRTNNDQQIPTLQEVFDLVRNHAQNTQGTERNPNGTPAIKFPLINIELKGVGTAEPTAKLIRKYRDTYTDTMPGIIVSSFNHGLLERFRNLDESTAIAVLFDQWAIEWEDIAAKLGAIAVNLSSRIATASRVAQITAADYLVCVYTVNKLGRARELQARGVRGVFTDRPDKLRSLMS